MKEMKKETLLEDTFITKNISGLIKKDKGTPYCDNIWK